MLTCPKLRIEAVATPAGRSDVGHCDKIDAATYWVKLCCNIWLNIVYDTRISVFK